MVGRQQRMLHRSLLRCCIAAATPLLAPYSRNLRVSSRAWQRIAEKNKEEGFTDDARFLRLAIDSGGCHGYLYKFSFEPMDSFDKEEDLMMRETDPPGAGERAAGAAAHPAPQVVVDKTSLEKLQSAVLDYHSELKGSAFVVVGNELVDQSCACALSFSLRRKGGVRPSTEAAAGEPTSASDAAFLRGSSRGGGTAISRRRQ